MGCMRIPGRDCLPAACQPFRNAFVAQQQNNRQSLIYNFIPGYNYLQVRAASQSLLSPHRNNIHNQNYYNKDHHNQNHKSLPTTINHHHHHYRITHPTTKPPTHNQPKCAPPSSSSA
jgi:hypothetical protein